MSLASLLQIKRRNKYGSIYSLLLNSSSLNDLDPTDVWLLCGTKALTNRVVCVVFISFLACFRSCKAFYLFLGVVTFSPLERLTVLGLSCIYQQATTLASSCLFQERHQFFLGFFTRTSSKTIRTIVREHRFYICFGIARIFKPFIGSQSVRMFL